MPDEDFSRRQWERLDEWLARKLGDVGMGIDGDRRRDTQHGFLFLDLRRREWDEPETKADRDFVRSFRKEHEDRRGRFKGWLWGILALLASIVVPFILAKLGLK
jgi:hypothetical protein